MTPIRGAAWRVSTACRLLSADAAPATTSKLNIGSGALGAFFYANCPRIAKCKLCCSPWLLRQRLRPSRSLAGFTSSMAGSATTRITA